MSPERKALASPLYWSTGIPKRPSLYKGVCDCAAPVSHQSVPTIQSYYQITVQTSSPTNPFQHCAIGVKSLFQSSFYSQVITMHLCSPLNHVKKKDGSYDASSECTICGVDTDKLKLPNSKRPIMQIHFRHNEVCYDYYAKAESYKLREPMFS